MSTELELISTILKNHTVINGIIQDRGKFEGETVATPYYYGLMLEGDGDVIEVTEEDEKVLSEHGVVISAGEFVYVRVSNYGFVSLEFFSTLDEAERKSNQNLFHY